MNIKRFVLAFFALFLFIFGYETLVHGFLLTSLYQKTPTLWRDYAQMISYAPFNTMIMGFIALWLTFIFTQLFKDGGIVNGMRFGLYFGVLSGIQAAGAYYYLPISQELAFYWFGVYVIESLIGGYLIGLIYKK